MSGSLTATMSTIPATLRAELGQDEFEAIAALLYQETGITLASSKLDLVQGRLMRRLRALRTETFADYLTIVSNPEASEERRHMVNALTTNLTSFFRESHHFDYLGNTILSAIAAGQPSGGRLRIWSAGCSSGEEPFSIAMTVGAKLPNLQRWDARILATDIDTNMVATGNAGRYDLSRVESVPETYRKRFLVRADGGATAQIAGNIRELVAFRQLNLLGAWPMRGRFDVIFCRNVVIYFDKATQRSLFDRFADILTPRGWLIVGHSETLFRLSERFESCGRTIYRKLT